MQPNHLVNAHYLLHVSYPAHGLHQRSNIRSGKDSGDRGWYATQVNRKLLGNMVIYNTDRVHNYRKVVIPYLNAVLCLPVKTEDKQMNLNYS